MPGSTLSEQGYTMNETKTLPSVVTKYCSINSKKKMISLLLFPVLVSFKGKFGKNTLRELGSKNMPVLTNEVLIFPISRNEIFFLY